MIIQDPTLLRQVNVLGGLRPDGYVLVNSSRPAEQLGVGPAATVITVAATDLAMRHLGRPVPNAALLVGFAALTELLRLDSVTSAIRQRFPHRVAEGNAAAATEAYETVRAGLEELSRA